MQIDRMKAMLGQEENARSLVAVYGREAPRNLDRLRRLLDTTESRFSPTAVRIFSTPGRAELGGNHTDHNGGKVLAASVQLDSIACVEQTDRQVVELHSEGYPDPIRVDLRRLEKRPDELGKTEALVRGIAARFADRGHRVGGFRGCVASSVLPGSGLSSSASVEILIATIFDRLYNDGSLSTTEISLAGQYAENHYFGKPCGLMDQIACASGGVVAIDFLRAEEPQIEQVQTAFSDYGYSLVIVNTGGSHADLTPDYAAVPEEMRSVAESFGKRVLRETSRDELVAALPALRAKVGDRALLRSLHFFADNERVDRQIGALRDGRMEDYLAAVRSAGDSSWELLQNNYSPANVREQGVPLALALSRLFLGESAAVRVQGGGFAGTVQAYVPLARSEEFCAYMDGFFGTGCATQLRVRNAGTIELFVEEAAH